MENVWEIVVLKGPDTDPGRAKVLRYSKSTGETWLLIGVAEETPKWRLIDIERPAN